MTVPSLTPDLRVEAIYELTFSLVVSLTYLLELSTFLRREGPRTTHRGWTALSNLTPWLCWPTFTSLLLSVTGKGAVV